MEAGRNRMVLIGLGAIILLAIGVAVGVALSGSGSKDNESAAVATVPEGNPVSSAGSPIPGRTTTQEPSTNCDDLGINFKEQNEGTCSEGKRKFTVVNRDSTLKLKQLDARLTDTYTTDSFSGGYIGDATAKGIYVVFRLAVTNRTHSPQTFDQAQDQVSLLLDPDVFTESFKAENGPNKSSFLWRSVEIQPGQTTSGEVVFDVPPDRLRDVKTIGNLDILNFSDAGGFGRPSVIGTIRTYPPKS